MSKFKKGDIVRITAKERQSGWNTEGEMDKYIGMLVEVDDVKCDSILFSVVDYTDGDRWFFKSEEAELVYRPSDHSDRYEDGLNDAWEAAKAIYLDDIHGGLSYETLMQLFGTGRYDDIFRKYNAREAVQRTADYKEQKDENARKELQDLADKYGIHRIYALAKDMRGE